jgi:thiol-disulfide isomerase/thioredoxin
MKLVFKSILACAIVVAVTNAAAQVERITIDQLDSRYRNGGDTTFVVNFWATWCRPCVKELPYFDKLSRWYQDTAAVRVLLVSVDDVKDQEKVSKFLVAKSYSPQSYIVADSNPGQWIDAVDSSWSGAIPATLFVRGAGRVRRLVENEFTYQQLEQTFNDFRKDEP